MNWLEALINFFKPSGVEKRQSRRPHKPQNAGSSPVPATNIDIQPKAKHVKKQAEKIADDVPAPTADHSKASSTTLAPVPVYENKVIGLPHTFVSQKAKDKFVKKIKKTEGNTELSKVDKPKPVVKPEPVNLTKPKRIQKSKPVYEKDITLIHVDEKPSRPKISATSHDWKAIREWKRGQIRNNQKLRALSADRKKSAERKTYLWELVADKFGVYGDQLLSGKYGLSPPTYRRLGNGYYDDQNDTCWYYKDELMALKKKVESEK